MVLSTIFVSAFNYGPHLERVGGVLHLAQRGVVDYIAIVGVDRMVYALIIVLPVWDS